MVIHSGSVAILNSCRYIALSNAIGPDLCPLSASQLDLLALRYLCPLSASQLIVIHL